MFDMLFFGIFSILF